jgi:hypothetical protein
MGKKGFHALKYPHNVIPVLVGNIKGVTINCIYQMLLMHGALFLITFRYRSVGKVGNTNTVAGHCIL